MRFLSLDVIRALAALSVLWTHWASLTHLPAISRVDDLFHGLFWSVYVTQDAGIVPRGLHPGVIAFIVLSGFCIHLPNIGKRMDWRQFARRRFFRIVPVYWCAVILGLIAAALTLEPEPRIGWGWAVDLRLTFLSEFGSPVDLALGNPPLYTVISEMWLYAAYPLLLLARRYLAWPLLVLIGTAIQLAASLLIRDIDVAQTCAWWFWVYWMLGAWAAERFASAQTKQTQPHRWRPYAVMLLYISANLVWPLPIETYVIGKSLLLAVVVAVILHDLLLREARSTRPRSALVRALAWVGRWSYSLYATHWPVLALLPAACVFPVALAVYALIERPSHSFARSGFTPNRRAVHAPHAVTPLIRTAE